MPELASTSIGEKKNLLQTTKMSGISSTELTDSLSCFLKDLSTSLWSYHGVMSSVGEVVMRMRTVDAVSSNDKAVHVDTGCWIREVGALAKESSKRVYGLFAIPRKFFDILDPDTWPWMTPAGSILGRIGANQSFILDDAIFG